jgi:hypothetical protein
MKLLEPQGDFRRDMAELQFINYIFHVINHHLGVMESQVHALCHLFETLLLAVIMAYFAVQTVKA